MTFATRSGPIHTLSGIAPPFARHVAATFSAAATIDLPVTVVRPLPGPDGGVEIIGEGRLIGAESDGEELIGTIEWPQDIEDEVGGSSPIVHCEWDDDGELAGAIVQVGEYDDPYDDECGGDCGCDACEDAAMFAKGGGAKSAKAGKSSKGGAAGSSSSSLSSTPGKTKLSGGSWVTIAGHPVYVKGGKVIAGGIPGVTHSARGRKPAAKSAPIDKADVPLARAFVKKQRAAARIRKNAPGKDTSRVDHAAMVAKVKESAASKAKSNGDPKPYDWRYEHGAPKSPADREHLRRAEAKGGSAVKVTDTPKVDVERGRNSTGYSVGGEPVARVTHAKVAPADGEPGGYKVGLISGRTTSVEYHRTLRQANGAARKHAAKESKGDARVRRLVVGKRAEIDPSLEALASGNHTSTFRTIHGGRGGAVGFAGIGDEDHPDPGPCDRGCICGDAAKADDMAKIPQTVAAFNLDLSGGEADGDFVRYKGVPLFVAGSYPAKSFAMSSDELRAAVDAFDAPVPAELEHINSNGEVTFLDGEMGHVEAVRLADDGVTMLGDVAVDRWVDRKWDKFLAKVGEKAKQVSCVWDRETKRLGKLGLVIRGHVPGAALTAAFSDRDDDTKLDDVLATFATPRKHDPELSEQMQAVHDSLAKNHPWACGGGGKAAPSPPMGNPPAMFGDKPKQFKAIKALHDQTTEHGAMCPGNGKSKVAPFSGRSPMSVFNRVSRALFGASAADLEYAPDITEEEVRKISAVLAGHDTDSSADGSGRSSRADVTQKETEATVPAPAAFSLADAPEFIALQKELAAAKAKNDEHTAELERRRVNEVAAFCAARAKDVITADKAPAADYDDILAEFSEAAEADHAARGTDRATVTFSAGDGTDATVTGTRVAKLEARYARRSKLGLLGHAGNGRELPEGATLALFSQGKKEVDPEVERRELLNKTPAGRAVLEREDAAKTK